MAHTWPHLLPFKADELTFKNASGRREFLGRVFEGEVDGGDVWWIFKWEKWDLWAGEKKLLIALEGLDRIGDGDSVEDFCD